jgi:hypothetical protein
MDMGSMRKVIGFSVPPAIEREVGEVAKAERRTKSELFREMFRVYKRYRQHRDQEENDWVMNLIAEAKAEQAANPMSPEELVAELKELSRDVAAQAKKRGITLKDVDRIIYESRKKWGTA